MKNTFVKRMLGIVLCAAMLLSYLPGSLSIRTQAASTQSGILSSETVADPSTLNAWKDTAFNPYDLNTEHAGGVWTDKTVVKAADVNTVFVDKNGDPLGLSAGADNFLVALSALGANSVIAGQGSTPTDTIFVLDVSNSMENTDLSSMVTATNDSINSLLAANADNRVGVVVYSTSVNVLLPLDRYTPVQKGYGSNVTTAYIEMAENYSQIRSARTGNGYNTTYVKNSGGANVQTSISASGATYIQGGLWQAYQMFNNATVTDIRTPVLVLMSDGAPSYGTRNYNSVSTTSRDVGGGGSNSITDGLAFLTQLTAAYVKEKISDKYNTSAYLYTVGLGVSESSQNTSIAEVVLDSSKTRQNTETWWNTYLGLANQTAKTMSFNAAGSNVTVTYDATITSASKNYTDRYFPASDASQLGSAFQGIVNEINLKARYIVTRIDGTDAHSSGYVTFVDEIGTGMQVKGIKGILIGDTLYTGENLAKALINSEFGTAEQPTELGNNMVWALKQRLGITDLVMDTASGTVTVTATERIHDLIRKAYNAKQISYNAATGDFSNLICWFSDANGNYLGFWDAADPNCAIPEGAAYANASYGMLGTTTASQTAHASDMMYVAVTVSKKVTEVDGAAALEEKTPELVTFRVPASLLPTVTYQINVEAQDGEHITEQTAATITYNEADPIRLVYEVGVHSALTPDNIQDFLREGYASKDADGNYYLYTNAWYWEPSTGVADPSNPPTKDNDVGKDVLYDTGKNHITYAYFEPSEQNEHYYFTEDTDLYTYNGSSYEKVTSAPVTDGSVKYYFQHKTFVSKSTATQTNVEVDAQVHIHYGVVSQKLLEDSSNYALDATSGTYYIKKGTMHYETIHDHDKDKATNATGSYQYRLHQLVDIAVDGNDVATHNYEIVYMGNNGRVTYSPAQGFTLNKVMAQQETATGAFTFNVTVSSDTDGKYTETRSGVSTQKDMSGNTFSLTLEAGQSVTVTGLDVDAVYTVTEQAQDGYMLGGVVASAGVVSGATVTATVAENQIHNITYTNDTVRYGSLLVTKTVTYEKGSQPQTDTTTYPITVKLEGLAGQQIYANNTQITLDANGEYSFQLGNGQQMLLTGIVEGTAYTVTEDASALTAGYRVVAGSFNGNIAADQTAVAGVQNAYTPEDVVLTNTEPQVAIDITKNFYLFNGINGYLFNGRRDFEFELLRNDSQTNQWVPVTVNGSAVKTTTAFINPYTNEDPVLGTNTKTGIALNLQGVTFDYAGNHYFRIAEVIPAAENQRVGMAYDRTHHDFVVVVADTDLDGQLEITEVRSVQNATVLAPVDQNGDGVAELWQVSSVFNNSEIYASAKLTLAANKTFAGAALEDGQFDFALYKTGADYDITGITPINAKNGANGDVVFTTETYPYDSQNQTYYYVMKELSADGNGVTTDKTVWEIEVTVVPSGTQAQISAVKYRQKGQTAWTEQAAPADNVFDTITFANTYTATPATVELGGNKTLTNRTPGVANADMTAAIAAGDFRFLLTKVSGADGSNTIQVQNSQGTVFGYESVTSAVQAGGSISFAGGAGDRLYFDQAGTYVFKLAEVRGAENYITYDASEYQIRVVVTDDGVGHLSAVATYWLGDMQVNEIVFNNTYTAAPATGLKIHAHKVLNVSSAFDRPLVPNDFRATLSHPDGTKETVYNDINGNFNFAALSFDAVGTYNYSISEVIPANAANNKQDGVTYDGVAKDFTIVVEDDGNGKLVAKLNGTQTLTDSSILAATIENTYEAAPTSIHLLAHKDLEGRELSANEFSFQIEAITANAPMPQSTVARNDAAGDVNFGAIQYGAVGTYQYKVTEQKLDENGDPLTLVNGEYVYKGVTYSVKEYTVTVTVLDLRNGNLVAHISSVDENNDAQPGGVVFTNIYKAAPVQVSIEGDDTAANGKIFTDQSSLPQNQKDMDDYEFRFVLTELDGTVIETVSDNGAGFEFADITYDATGTYQYLIREVPGNDVGVTYDTAKYRVTVTVTDNGEGNLVADVVYEKAENAESNDYAATGGILFENSYRAKETSVSFAGKKTLTGGRKLKADDFSFVLKNASGEALETVKNAADGTFTFAQITYYSEGIYVYTLEEVQGNAEGIAYDTAKYTLTVTVTDVSGELVAATAITKDTAAADVAGFINIYTPKDVSATIQVQKELVNKSTEKMGLDGFKFLLDGNGAQQTLTTDNSGKAEATLTFTAQDVGQSYTYRLSEIAGNNQYMQYDTTAYVITVTVSQAEDGQLQLAIERSGSGAFKFVNTYNGMPRPEVPKTGDDINLGLTTALMLSSVACLFVLMLSRKRPEEQEA